MCGDDIGEPPGKAAQRGRQRNERGEDFPSAFHRDERIADLAHVGTQNAHFVIDGGKPDAQLPHLAIEGRGLSQAHFHQPPRSASYLMAWISMLRLRWLAPIVLPMPAEKPSACEAVGSPAFNGSWTVHAHPSLDEKKS